MRALGSEVDDQTHREVEAALKSKGVEPPPLLSSPIYVEEALGGDGAFGKVTRIALAAVAVLVVAAVVRATFNTWAGLVIILAGGCWLLYRRTSKDASRESSGAGDGEFEAAARSLGLNEAMKAAAKGDKQRLVDLLNYGAPVNAVDGDGADALIYAAMNGKADCVELLLARGADPLRKTNKGSSAVSLARKAGHPGIAELIERATK